MVIFGSGMVRRKRGCFSSMGPGCGLQFATGCRLIGSGSGSIWCRSTLNILTWSTEMRATLDVAPLDDTGTAVAAAEVPLFGRFKGVTFWDRLQLALHSLHICRICRKSFLSYAIILMQECTALASDTTRR